LTLSVERGSNHFWLSLVLCAMAALAADLEAVRLAVQAAVGTRNKTWKHSMWSDFIKDVVSFLVDEKREDPDNVVEAAVGLIVYGATTQEKLQGVGQGEYAEFKLQLTADKYGVPAAICDLLFAQYVAGKSDRGRSSSGRRMPGSFTSDMPVRLPRVICSPPARATASWSALCRALQRGV
jgi:hypothetical protein